MISKKVIVNNLIGFHARPSCQVAQTALSFESKIVVEKDGIKADATSIMSLSTIFSPKGTELTIYANGIDEQEAVDSIIRLFEEGFGER